MLNLAAFLGQVARAVGLDAGPNIGAAALFQALAHAESDGLRAAPRARKRQGAGAVQQQVGHDIGGLRRGGPSHRGPILAGQVRHHAWLPQRNGALADRRAVLRHGLHWLADQATGLVGRVVRRRRGENYRRGPAVFSRQPQQPPQYLGDVRSEHAPVRVALVDNYVPQLSQHPRPPRMITQNGNVQHIRVRKHPARGVADGAPGIQGRVAVVKRNAGGEGFRRQPAGRRQLIRAERLRRRQVQCGRVGGGGKVRQNRQQIAQRLARGGARRHHAMRSRVREIGGRHLMSPQLLYPALGESFAQPARHPLRPRGSNTRSRGQIGDVRHRRARMRLNDRRQQLPPKRLHRHRPRLLPRAHSRARIRSRLPTPTRPHSAPRKEPGVKVNSTKATRGAKRGRLPECIAPRGAACFINPEVGKFL